MWVLPPSSTPSLNFVGWLFQAAPEWQNSQHHELEVLLGKRKANDRNRHQEPPDSMIEGDRPAEDKKPNHIQNQYQGRADARPFDNLFAKWGKRGDPNLNGCDPKGDANDGQAGTDTAQDVAESAQKTTENQPDNIAE